MRGGLQEGLKNTEIEIAGQTAPGGVTNKVAEEHGEFQHVKRFTRDFHGHGRPSNVAKDGAASAIIHGARNKAL